jgi:hypothetical protein
MYFAIGFDKVNYQQKVINDFVHNDQYYYVTETKKIYYFDQKQTLSENGSLTLEKIVDGEVVSIILLALLSFVSFMVLLISIIEGNYNIDKVFYKAVNLNLRSKIVKDDIDYIIFGRYLRSINKNETYRYDVKDALYNNNIKSIYDIMTLPKYTNISIERSRKLKKVLS